MLAPINLWMDSKDAFGPVPLCNCSDVAIVTKKALVLEYISQIRLDLRLLLMIPLFQIYIYLNVCVMFLTCVKY